jgi:hypothetical protein
MPDIEKNFNKVINEYTDPTSNRNKVYTKYYPKILQGKPSEYIIVQTSPYIGNVKVDPSIGYINNQIYQGDTIDIFSQDLNKYSISKQEFENKLVSPYITGSYGYVPPINNPNYFNGSHIIPILGEILNEHLFILKSKISNKLIILTSMPSMSTQTVINKYKAELKKILQIDNVDSILKTRITGILNELYKEGISQLSKIGAIRLVAYIKNKYTPQGKPIQSNFPINFEDPRTELDKIRQNINGIIDGKIMSSDISSIVQLVNVFKSTDRKKQHIIKNWNDPNEKVCYDFDLSTLENLINAGADMNVPDKVGKTPIFYAIDSKNLELIEKLLEPDSKVTTYSKRSIDIAGNTPYSYAGKKLKECVTPKDIKQIFNDANKQILDDIRKDYITDIMEHSDIIMKWVLYLVNHQLKDLEYKALDNLSSKLSKDCDGDWTYADHKKLGVQLGIPEGAKNLPFLELEKAGDAIDTSHLQEGQILQYRNKIDKYENRLNALANSIKEIRNELRDTNIDPIKSVQLGKLEKQTEKYYNEMQAEINRLNASSSKMQKSQTKLKNSMSTQPKFMVSVIQNMNLDKYAESFDIIRIYEAIFDKWNEAQSRDGYLFINYEEYTKRWEELLRNNDKDKNDSTQLPLNVLDQLTKLPEKEIDNYKKCDVYCKYLSCVINPHINDYFLLSRVYERHNYLLDSFVHIYVHVIRHTICANYNALLLKETLEHLSKIAPNDLKKTTSKFKHIFSEINKPRSVSWYVMRKIPDLIVRNILGIHKHDKEEAATSNVTDLLKKAAKMIAENSEGIIDSSDKSAYLERIYKNIVPYIEIHCRKFVEAMNKNVEMYLRILENTIIDVKIFEMVHKHTDGEKKYYESAH